MKQMISKDDAVSPVVGVMLMLVVTIIIAAVVSSFAGGLADDTRKTPQATIVAKKIVVNSAYDGDLNNWAPDPIMGKASDAYVIFEHMGGDGINLNNIEIHISALKYRHEKSMISNARKPMIEMYAGERDNISGFSNEWKNYLEGYPDKAGVISPGSLFVLHADYAQWTFETNEDGTVKTDRTVIGWRPDNDHIGTGKGLTVEIGDYLTYDIVDKITGRSISSGQILMPKIHVQGP